MFRIVFYPDNCLYAEQGAGVNRYLSEGSVWLQYLMGHSDISVTMNSYTHLELEDAVDEMNRMKQLESARKEQEALMGKTDEVKISKKHFRAG